MKCDFCGRDFKLSQYGYRLLPILDLRSFPPRGVYACAECVESNGEDELISMWFELTMSSKRPRQMLLSGLK